MKYILDRLKEKSTWTGLVSVVLSAILWRYPEFQEPIQGAARVVADIAGQVAGGTLLVGGLGAILYKERK